MRFLPILATMDEHSSFPLCPAQYMLLYSEDQAAEGRYINQTPIAEWLDNFFFFFSLSRLPIIKIKQIGLIKVEIEKQ